MLFGASPLCFFHVAVTLSDSSRRSVDIGFICLTPFVVCTPIQSSVEPSSLSFVRSPLLVSCDHSHRRRAGGSLGCPPVPGHLRMTQRM